MSFFLKSRWYSSRLGQEATLARWGTYALCIAGVLGEAFLPEVLTPEGFAVSLAAPGMETLTGHTSAALGDPLAALRWLCGELVREGLALPAGSIVLTGGLTPAPYLLKGQEIRAEFAQLGVVTFRL